MADYKIKLIKSTFYKEKKTKAALCQFITDSRQLSIGEQCAAFEAEFSQWQGKAFSVLYNSGSSANLALVQALLNMGILQNKMRVGFSGITWATNVMPLMQLGLSPVPVDVELDTLNCSVQTLAEVHEKQPLDAFFITNLLGFSDDIEAVRRYCKREGIVFLEDNCESLGSVYRGKKLGNFGLASTFSFFVGHHMSGIEGGMVCTDDSELDQQLRMVRSHGWDRHLTADQQEKLRTEHKVTPFFAKYTFYDLAYNLRPTEITGFLGRNQLHYLDEMVMKRERNFHEFMKIYDMVPSLVPLRVRMDTCSNFAMPLVFRTKDAMREYKERCERRHIEIRPIVGGVMSDQPFFRKYIRKKYAVPNSRMAFEQGFYFANNPELSAAEVQYILKTFA